MIISEENKLKIINFLFLLIPISFIGGNLFINLNVILLLLLSLIFYGTKILKYQTNIYDKLLLFFFLIIVFSGVSNSYFYYFPEKSIYAEEILFKTLLFFRFFILFFVIKYLICENILKLKFFFISAAMCSMFVGADVLLQFFTGEDIFGYKNFDRRNPGPFGDEAISGSYLQRFSFFLFFLVPVFFKKFQNKFYFFLIFFIFLAIFCATLFSGNKFPFVMFVISIFIFVLFVERSRKLAIILLFVCPVIFASLYKFSYEVKNNFSNFYNKIKQIETYASSFVDSIGNDKEIVIPQNNNWLKEIHNGILAFNTKKILGGGLKSYKISCPKVSKYSCNHHPHNYHIEILVSSGMIGYIPLLIIFFHSFHNFFVKNYYTFSRNRQILLALFFTLFFTESFPLKTSGSFFSTANATYFFIILSIAISLGVKKST